MDSFQEWKSNDQSQRAVFGLIISHIPSHSYAPRPMDCGFGADLGTGLCLANLGVPSTTDPAVCPEAGVVVASGLADVVLAQLIALNPRIHDVFSFWYIYIYICNTMDNRLQYIL